MSNTQPKRVKKQTEASETPGGDTRKLQRPEKTGKKRGGNPPVEYQFKPGNPGRPKGARNKLGEAFLYDMLADWEKHGGKVIARVREEKPEAYLKTVASILPQQMNVKVEPFEEMTDEQLRRHAERLLAELGPIAAFANGRDTERVEQAPPGKPLN